MIPVKLHLHNFLSYGDQSEPIEFAGIHVACLCGPNGNGKSALLDAITWSLWGQARSNSADDLVRQGQASMWVDFEFLLDGQHFRVVRKRAKGRNSQSDLQFQVRKPDGSWHALTGQGVRGTQERIVQALRMEYDTFINSAFILQGRADEFARKTAGDRKRILGEILSLGVYDELCEKSRLRRREAEMRVASADLEIGRMEREQSRLPELCAQVERLEDQHGQLKLVVEQARSEHASILVEKAQMDGCRKERDDLARRLEVGEGELAVVRQQLSTVQARIQRCRALLQRAREIRERSQELHALRTEQAELAARANELRRLEGEKSLLERRLHEAQSRLERELDLARHRMRDLNALAAELPRAKQQEEDLAKQVAALERLDEERSALQEQLPRLAAERASAGAEQQRCLAEFARVEQRFQMLKEAKERPICPLCGGDMTAEKRKELGWDFRREKDELKAAQGRAIEREGEARRLEAEVTRRVQQLAGELRTGQQWRERLAQVRQHHLRCAEAAASLPAETAVAAQLEARLKSQEFEAELRAAVGELDKRLQALSFDEKQYSRTAARIEELGEADRELHALEGAEAALPAEEEHAKALQVSIDAKEGALADDRARRAEADRILQRAPEIDAETGRREAIFKEAQRMDAAISQQLGGAREQLQRCKELAPQIEEKKRQRRTAAQDQAAYEELSKAFGRNGIQALIIENALPEIENEANGLLQRMTDGQLNVQLKTQKDLRGGGQAETLDIEISDGAGARKYELFSGGEAFRVNFALRIALSKMLAGRAGARLETLVIDEGFGSQDLEGRQRLVEAIHAVQDDFAKILVITHLDDLKDAFPTRVEVTKNAAGSQVAIY